MDLISCFLVRCPENNEFNDVRVVYSEEHLKMLLNSGIDLPLAKHIAHFFARDPLCIFSDKIHQDNEKESVHFEVIKKLPFCIWIYIIKFLYNFIWLRRFILQIGKQCD